MTIKIDIRIEDKGFKELVESGEFQRKFNRQASRQLLPVGQKAKNEIQKYVMQEQIDPGLGVQRYIKGSDKTLLWTGDMAQGFTFKYKKNRGIVGIEVKPKKGQHYSGATYNQIISQMVKGRKWVPSKGERKAVQIKALASGAPSPTGSKKDVWEIPSRPFVEQAIMTDEFIKYTVNAVLKTIDKTLEELTSE